MVNAPGRQGLDAGRGAEKARAPAAPRPSAREAGCDIASARTAPATREVVLHYHLFKNAGTSLDTVFRRNFPDAWTSREFAPGSDHGEAVARWIAETPEARVFSSHTALGPLPEVPGVRVFPILFLRDPIARIRSAYRFERRQQADTYGSRLAREHDFAGYVRARLARPGDRQCRDFQTQRLAAFRPGPEDEHARARAALEALPFVGLVERFAASLERLAEALPTSLSLEDRSVPHANRSDATEEGVPDAETLALLRAANAGDLALLAALRRRLEVSSGP